MRILLLLLASLLSLGGFAHGYDDTPLRVKSGNFNLAGTLCTPGHAGAGMPLVLIVPGSGPTDRNGNNNQGLKTDAYVKLAHTLAMQGIASYRYDKRGIGESADSTWTEEKMRFGDMVDDVKAILTHFTADQRFGPVTILGHSEGSLIGMLAARETDRFISVAGPGEPAALTLKRQLKGKLGPMEAGTLARIDSLEKGLRVSLESPMLAALLRPSVQPYLISWFAFDPAKQIAKLKGPVLIVNGTKDLQVGEEQAKLLHAAQPNAKLLIVENMNHVLTELNTAEQTENMASYSKPELPLSQKLVQEIAGFVR